MRVKTCTHARVGACANACDGCAISARAPTRTDARARAPTSFRARAPQACAELEAAADRIAARPGGANVSVHPVAVAAAPGRRTL